MPEKKNGSIRRWAGRFDLIVNDVNSKKLRADPLNLEVEGCVA